MITTILRPFMGYISLGLLILVAALFIAFKVEQRHSRKLAERNVVLTQLRESDRQAYEAAQREAALRNQAQVQKIEAKHEAITQAVRSNYARDLERLRAQARANPRSPGQPGASGVPKAAGGVDADGVPGAACDNLCAQEIELRLMHLQNWVREQAGVK